MPEVFLPLRSLESPQISIERPTERVVSGPVAQQTELEKIEARIDSFIKEDANLNPFDSNSLLHSAYMEESPSEQSIWNSKYNILPLLWNSKANFLPSAFKATCWYADRFGQKLMSNFYESNFDILLSIVENDQLVRASKSSFFRGNEKDDFLYSYNPTGGICTFIKKFCFEGTFFGRNEADNAIRVAELTPRILLTEAEKMLQNFVEKLEGLASPAAFLLKDDQYQNAHYLEGIAQELESFVRQAKSKAVSFEVSGDGTAKSTLKKVKSAIEGMLDHHFKSVKDRANREYYRIDELRVSLSDYFKEVNKVSELVRKRQNEILNQVKLTVGSRADQAKHKIFVLLDECHKLKDEYQALIHNLREKCEDFDLERKNTL